MKTKCLNAIPLLVLVAATARADLGGRSIELESIVVAATSGDIWRIKKTHDVDGKRIIVKNASDTPLVFRSSDRAELVLAGKEALTLPCTAKVAYHDFLVDGALLHTVAAVCGDVIHLTVKK